MLSGGIEVNWLAQIRIILEAKLRLHDFDT